MLVTEQNVDIFSLGDAKAKVTVIMRTEVGGRREGEELKERVMVSS